MKVYRSTDRIPVKIGDAVFTLAPLTRHQRQDIIASARKNESGVTIENAIEMAALSMKYAIKNVGGIVGVDGVPWVPKFDDKGFLSEESIDDLFNIIDEDLPLISAMIAMADNIPKMLKLKGVSIDEVVVEKK
jgi:hypothetical protein